MIPPPRSLARRFAAGLLAGPVRREGYSEQVACPIRIIVVLMHLEVADILGHFANSLPKRYVQEVVI